MIVTDRSTGNGSRNARSKVPAAPRPRRTARHEPASTPFAFVLKHAAIRDGSVKLVDDLVGRFVQEVVNLQAEASGLTTDGG